MFTYLDLIVSPLSGHNQVMCHARVIKVVGHSHCQREAILLGGRVAHDEAAGGTGAKHVNGTLTAECAVVPILTGEHQGGFVASEATSTIVAAQHLRGAGRHRRRGRRWFEHHVIAQIGFVHRGGGGGDRLARSSIDEVHRVELILVDHQSSVGQLHGDGAVTFVVESN